MSSAFFSAVLARRSQYALTKKSTISDLQLKTLVETAVKHTPSPYNSQSARVVLLLGKESDKLWEIVKTNYLPTLGGDPSVIELYTSKFAGYASGYGTVLFFDDTSVVEQNMKHHHRVAAQFPEWSDNASGMLQYVIWTALAAEGIGASLQHYGAYATEVVDGVRKEWKLPSSWKSTAMMPFGVPGKEPGPKTFVPIEERVKVFGSGEE